MIHCINLIFAEKPELCLTHFITYLYFQKLIQFIWLNPYFFFYCVAQVVLPDHWELGYPDGPEMDVYKKLLQQFMNEWDQMQVILNVSFFLLEIREKNPKELLKEIISVMESK